MFPGPTGGPISPDSVLHILHPVLKRAGLPRVRFHDLRHTFAMLALQNGVDIKTVSGMLGHFSAGFTLDTYAHVTTAAQKEAARTMEKSPDGGNLKDEKINPKQQESLGAEGLRQGTFFCPVWVTVGSTANFAKSRNFSGNFWRQKVKKNRLISCEIRRFCGCGGWT